VLEFVNPAYFTSELGHSFPRDPFYKKPHLSRILFHSAEGLVLEKK